MSNQFANQNTGVQIAQRAREIIREGNTRRLIIRQRNGSIITQMSLTVAALIAFAMTVFMPYWLIAVALGILIFKARFEITKTSID